MSIIIIPTQAQVSKFSSWYGVDLDGTLATYGGWKGRDHIGEPIKPMVDRIKAWLAAGETVKIFTARACEPEAIPPIKAWCIKHIGVELEVTNIKDYGMIEIWDDRAVRVVFNQGHPCCDHEYQRKDHKRKSQAEEKEVYTSDKK